MTCTLWHCGCYERHLQEQAVYRWPHVHRSPAALAGPRSRAACRGPCATDRLGPALAAGPRATCRGPCATDRLGPALAAGPRATRRGPCPADRLGSATAAGPWPRAARRGPCPADRPGSATGARPQPRAAPAGAGSASFAHNSLRPPFRIWWSQRSGAWHRG